MNKVAVIVNGQGQLSSFSHGEQVIIFENGNGMWLEMKRICFLMEKTIPQMRQSLNGLLEQLEECKILIGTVITGIPFQILDQAGFLLCEAETISQELFYQVLADYQYREGIKQDQQEEDYPAHPIETEESGVFELDLKRLQRTHPEISSKAAMIPLFQKENFVSLIVYCSHVMPWLDRELDRWNLKYEEEKVDGGYRVVITWNV